MCGTASRMTSPSVRSTSRSTPCVLGCCGPMLTSSSSVRTSNSTATGSAKEGMISPLGIRARLSYRERIPEKRMFATFLFLVLQPPADPFAKWEKEVSAIEKRHKETPPKKGGIVFAGSSTIRLWDVKKSFPDWDVANCGFGGNQVRDNTHFAPRLILPLEPRAIVFYAGDNDLNAGRTPEQVLEDFRAFTKTVREKLPASK